MRICLQIISLKQGGAEKLLVFLANELVGRGHEVFLLCVEDYCEEIFYPINDSVKVVKIPKWNQVSTGGLFGKKYRNFYRVMLMRSILAKIRPDVAVSFLTNMIIPTAWAAKSLRIPHVACERNSPWDTPEHPGKRERRNRAFAVSKGCVVQTEQIKAYFSWKIQQKTVVKPNPIVLTYNQDDIPVPFAERRKCIVSAGRLTKQKNQAMLIEAFAQFHNKHEDYQLIIYGQDYGMQAKLTDLIEKKRLADCVFLREPIQKLHEEIVDAAMFVMTSDYEGFPNALAEAAALGIPCISTDYRSGGPSAILQGGAGGILIPNRDVRALEEAMSLLAEDPGLADAFSRRGVELPNRYNQKDYVDFWERYLMEIAL